MKGLIETPRLYLRPFTLADVDELHRIWTKPGVRQYLWDDVVVPRAQVESIVETSSSLFADHGYGLWAVCLREPRSLIGFGGFWHFHEPPQLELLYGIDSAHWKQGYATELAHALIDYGFTQLGFTRIEASTDAAHEASVRVMERAGMTFWKRELTNGLDTIYFAIDRGKVEVIQNCL
jgi:[ribosomal protein S5]-alanine N-acetyltransferase